MYHSNLHTKLITINIFNQLKHIQSKALGGGGGYTQSGGSLVMAFDE